MPSDESFVEFVAGQMNDAGEIRYRDMFGGTTVYCNEKVVALICDNQLFVKPTKAGRAFIENVTESPPYTGAKSFFLIKDKMEDAEWLSKLIRLTCDELPEPRPKKKK